MTIQFPNTGSFSFTDLTLQFTSSERIGESASIPLYTDARLMFKVSELPNGVTVSVSNIALSGDGITSTLSFPDVTLTSTDEVTTELLDLDTPISSYFSTNNRVSFDIEIDGGSLPDETVLSYTLQYRKKDDSNITTPSGDVTLVAASE
jgi:hypothetical protein